MNEGVMKMRPVDKAASPSIPARPSSLRRAAYHLMITDLKSPLKQGDKMPVTLEFEKAGKVAVTLDVQGVGAPGPAAGGGGDMKKMDHSGMKM